jgi:hypothetical protein
MQGHTEGQRKVRHPNLFRSSICSMYLISEDKRRIVFQSLRRLQADGSRIRCYNEVDYGMAEVTTALRTSSTDPIGDLGMKENGCIPIV